MNKQTILGFALIGLILFGFTWYQGRQQQQFQAQQQAQLRVADSIARVEVEARQRYIDSLKATMPAAEGAESVAADPLGATLAAARGGQPQSIIIENDLAKYEFSSLGAKIADVTLKKFNAYHGQPVHLWRPGSEKFDISFFLRRDGRDAQVNTRDFNFNINAPSTQWAEGETSKQITMSLPVDSTARVEFVYTIQRNDYMVGLEVRFDGLENQLSNQSSFDIEWANTSLQNEKGFTNENNYTTIAYNYPGVNSVEQLGLQRAGGSKSESETSRLQWVAFKQQFFSSFLIAGKAGDTGNAAAGAPNGDAFQGADMGYVTSHEGSGTIKDFHTRVSVPMTRERNSYPLSFYFGPNHIPTLKSYDLAMDRVISMGWMSFGFITRFLVIPIFNTLGGHIANFGWIILILTLIIKTLISPLTFISYRSSAKMRVIKPETDEINARFPDPADAMKKQQATMELYRRAGINPLAGCLPMLLQMPFLLAMFRFFPEAIELRGQSLWWADDLSSYDSILSLPFNIPWYGSHVSLFTLLLAVAMHFSGRVSLAQQSSTPQLAGMKFMTLYLMPLMMLFFLNNYAAGLNFYYLISTIFSLAQIFLVRAMLNEDKLRRQMLETPRKERKKSGFMQRLEEAQKAQLAAARAQQQSNNRSRPSDTPPPVRGSRGNLPGNRKKR